MTTQPDRADEITRLLHQWKGGDLEARGTLIPVVYQTLRRLAERQFAGENPGHTLQPTALVHEAFLNLESSDVDWRDRQHFYAVAARAMRHILVDHARGKLRLKRGGGELQLDIDLDQIAAPEAAADLIALDQALDQLEAQSERTARVLELTYFGGLARDAVAEIMEISSRSVDRDLSIGRAWLRKQLKAGDPAA